MPEIFQVRHADPACREKICLQDYETAFAQHQEVQFRKYRKHSGYATPDQAGIAESFERFRAALWGEAGYASRIFLRLHPSSRAASHTLRLVDIAVGGEVLFEDMKALLEQGRVEVLVPGYFCGASGSGAGLEIYLDKGKGFTRADFKTLIRKLDELRPLHGEGMGNAFWFRCVEAIFPSPVEPTWTFRAAPVVLNLAQSLLSSLTAPVSSTAEVACDEEDIAYFDEDRGEPVCETWDEGEAEPEGGEGGVLAGLSQGLVLSFSSSAAAGSLHYFSRFGAERIGAMVLQGASDPQAE